MKVKYFAWVRERIGKAEETLEPPADVRTVNDLIADLGKVPGVSAESARKIFEFFHAQPG